MIVRQLPPQAAKQQRRPEEQSEDQQDLPEPAEVEVFEALIPDPAPTSPDPSENAGILAGEAAEDDDGEGGE